MREQPLHICFVYSVRLPLQGSVGAARASYVTVVPAAKLQRFTYWDALMWCLKRVIR